MSLSPDNTLEQSEYYKAIMESIMTSDGGCISSIEILNLVDHLDRRISKADAEKLVQKWVLERYLEEDETYVYLGVRTLVEMNQYLQDVFPEHIRNCPLCNGLIVYGSTCESCGGLIHCHCLKKFFKGGKEQRMCPNCKHPWTLNEAEKDGPNLSQTEMDPWSPSGVTIPCSYFGAALSFEDSFISSRSPHHHPSRLPDSKAYIKKLENKLSKLKAGSAKTSSATNDFLKSLEQSKLDQLVNYLNSNSVAVEDTYYINTPLQSSAAGVLIRRIAPQSQALSQEEILHLLEYDLLAHSVQLDDAIRASRGIGQEIAIQFSKKFGLQSLLTIVARNSQGLKETMAAIEAQGSNVTVKPFSVDLSKPDPSKFRKFLLQSLAETNTKPEDYDKAIIVHNAGNLGPVTKKVSSYDDLNEMREYFDSQVHSAICLNTEFLKIFSPDKVKNKTVINISSLAALQPFKGWGLYCAAKACRDAFCRNLAAEDQDLDVISYAPGPVETDMIQHASEASMKEVKSMIDDMRKKKITLSTEKTIGRLVQILTDKKYNSGGYLDECTSTQVLIFTSTQEYQDDSLVPPPIPRPREEEFSSIKDSEGIVHV
ncbi:unnamed protein product [Darwinula stevensoni]|uniref:Non-structural maintenance of chromosomes element 1 homolog n=1 Tax=Darwinula stevensoni TaxID=69355 RepID=A0A7R8X0K1_9CRUS|nr:unnamed protein product [Darwinula stevensoni]CAG0881261.1 unnamed protein product [Darwinula stevensoni]